MYGLQAKQSFADDLLVLMQSYTYVQCRTPQPYSPINGPKAVYCVSFWNQLEAASEQAGSHDYPLDVPYPSGCPPVHDVTSAFVSSVRLSMSTPHKLTTHRPQNNSTAGGSIAINILTAFQLGRNTQE